MHFQAAKQLQIKCRRSKIWFQRLGSQCGEHLNIFEITKMISKMLLVEHLRERERDLKNGKKRTHTRTHVKLFAVFANIYTFYRLNSLVDRSKDNRSICRQ